MPSISASIRRSVALFFALAILVIPFAVAADRPARKDSSTTTRVFEAIDRATTSEQLGKGNDDDKTTTGPVPPKGTDLGLHSVPRLSSQVVLYDVPGYNWRHGCGPTSCGMILAYWDGLGFELISGDADTQTTAVNEAIAGTDNYNDYCLPLDYSSTDPSPLPDKSELPLGDEHADNCLADFIETSQSVNGCYYGWSYNSRYSGGLTSYVDLVAPQYSASASYTRRDYSWYDYTEEIDAGRPVLLCVDTSGAGVTNHAIVGIGYSDDGGTRQYACRNTWDSGVHWYDWQPMAEGQPWGVASSVEFNIDANCGVSGSVADDLSGVPLPNMTVYAVSHGTYPAPYNATHSTDTTVGGTYQLGGLAPGQYTIWTESKAGYWGEYYNDSHNPNSTEAVTVALGQWTSGIDFELELVGAISGYVYAADGVTPIANAVVEAAYSSTGLDWGTYTTSSSGYYRISHLRPDTYLVSVDAPAPYTWEFYQDAYGTATAEAVTVVGGSTTAGIDFTVELPSSISGHVYESDGVTPISGAKVSYSTDVSMATPSTYSAADGSYSFTGLLPIRHYLSTSINGYRDESCTVGLQADQDVSGINFRLSAGSTIMGTLYDRRLAPRVGLAYETIELYGDHGSGYSMLGTTGTASDGTYRFDDLPPGDYYTLFRVFGPEPSRSRVVRLGAFGIIEGLDIYAYGGNATQLRVSDGNTDLDGDGKVDLVVWRPHNSGWYGLLSSKGYSISSGQYLSQQWGLDSDMPLIDDLDGDGKGDLIIWRPSNGTWYALLSTKGYSDAPGNYFCRRWGSTYDVPLTGDYDGDGKADLFVWRPSNGGWYGLLSSKGYSVAPGQYVARMWGSADDAPRMGDVDGDGRSDLIVWRETNGGWYARLSSTGYSTFLSKQWGQVDDLPILGDLDGDGRDDLIVWRESNGGWYALQSSKGYSNWPGQYFAQTWGLAGDVPILGNLGADAKMDPTVWRESSGYWFGLLSETGYSKAGGAYFCKRWGQSGDLPR